jgi:stage II sporulation protein D (peptidoglycan lytic transglycosylase)
MLRLKIFFILLIVTGTFAAAQVKIRLFYGRSPESALFSVTEGKYELNLFDGAPKQIARDEPVIITRYNGKLAVKIRNTGGFVCDSVWLTGKTGNDSFSLSINGESYNRQLYSNDLKCFPDMGTLVLINNTDIEKYISGVVLAEGGSGRNLEYFKTQAIIARTYMYRYFDKHSADGFNLCDNTHCQVFNGLSGDSLLNKAVIETRGQVILDKDSVLIMSAFHSNCGGETASSEDVWLTDLPYLRGVVDPYCAGSKNAKWQESYSLSQWANYLRKYGYKSVGDDPSVFNFNQRSRMAVYKAGSFTTPLTTIRSDLNLRSAFFSVIVEGDSVILKGKGYGHGVGLCQEGAMSMADKGFNYRQIINFYYPGVIISDIKNAVALLPGSSSRAGR